MRIHWSGIGAACVTLFGIVSSPAVIGFLPPHYAAAVTGAGMIAQAFTHKAVQPAPPQQ
jgi:hypothetical protein